MKTKAFALATALAGSAAAQSKPCIPYKLVESEKLQNAIKVDNLVDHLQNWQDIAYSYPERSRLVGVRAHNETLEYIIERLEALGDYYDIETQPYSLVAETFNNGSLVVDGVQVEAQTMEFSRNATLSGLKLVYVPAYGCNGTSDFPPEVRGNIALVSRGPTGGNCAFSTKAAHAGEAGAAGVIVYDNVPNGPTLLGRVLADDPPQGRQAPVTGVANLVGVAWADRLRAGEEIIVDSFVTESARFYAYSYNVIATTTRGDPDNILMVGAHSDSVAAGPGINDNGSGSAALLEIALRLSRYVTNNKVRFAWWTAEEEGLLGSYHWVEAQAPEDLLKIRLYLNFDMIASGNGINGVYDGDGSAFNLTGPPGSDVAEHFFEDYFASKNIPLLPTDFSGRSDYAAFLDYGVPSGGLFTGADGLKSEEEAEIFGGTAGLIYDPNYHTEFDTIANISASFFEVNAKAIAHSVAEYGRSWEGFPVRETNFQRRRDFTHKAEHTCGLHKSYASY